MQANGAGTTAIHGFPRILLLGAEGINTLYQTSTRQIPISFALAANPRGSLGPLHLRACVSRDGGFSMAQRQGPGKTERLHEHGWTPGQSGGTDPCRLSNLSILVAIENGRRFSGRRNRIEEFHQERTKFTCSFRIPQRAADTIPKPVAIFNRLQRLPSTDWLDSQNVFGYDGNIPKRLSKHEAALSSL